MMSFAHQLIKEVLREKLAKKRGELRVSQEEMAAMLHIAGRSYNDLENGVSCCSVETLVVFCTLLTEEELLEIFRILRRRIKKVEKGGAA